MSALGQHWITYGPMPKHHCKQDIQSSSSLPHHEFFRTSHSTSIGSRNQRRRRFHVQTPEPSGVALRGAGTMSGTLCGTSRCSEWLPISSQSRFKFAEAPDITLTTSHSSSADHPQILAIAVSVILSSGVLALANQLFAMCYWCFGRSICALYMNTSSMISSGTLAHLILKGLVFWMVPVCLAPEMVPLVNPQTNLPPWGFLQLFGCQVLLIGALLEVENKEERIHLSAADLLEAATADVGRGELGGHPSFIRLWFPGIQLGLQLHFISSYIPRCKTIIYQPGLLEDPFTSCCKLLSGSFWGNKRELL